MSSENLEEKAGNVIAAAYHSPHLREKEIQISELPSSTPISNQTLAEDGKTTSSTSSQSAEPATQLEGWNSPPGNKYRLVSAFLSFTLMGLNDGALGALIPYLEVYYNINYTVVSIVFISPMIAYILSACILDKVHVTFGQRGVAISGSCLRLLAYIILAFHPPWPVYIVCAVISSFGAGITDGAWCAWVAKLNQVNQIMGLLHGFYGLGALIAPLVATAMITKDNLPWYNYYYFAASAAALDVLVAAPAFWSRTAAVFREQQREARADITQDSGLLGAMKTGVVWLIAIFLLIYMGIEISLSGWTVTFMADVRGASPFDAGIGSTAFWSGMTAGRVILGFVTGRIGIRLASFIYLGLVLVFHLIFYLVPSLDASFAAVTLEGFFLGPMFPVAIILASDLLPDRVQVSGVGFAVAIGMVGSCVLPFLVGAVAQSKGVQVLMPIVLALIIAEMISLFFVAVARKPADKKPANVEAPSNTPRPNQSLAPVPDQN